MPLQLGRNPKSYPPNDAYRDNWDRMFAKGKPKPVKEARGANVIEHLTKAARERYCDNKPTKNITEGVCLGCGEKGFGYGFCAKCTRETANFIGGRNP